MSQEDYPVDFVLDSIEAVMAPARAPKVLLFDIGGVCVSQHLLHLDSYQYLFSYGALSMLQ
jgi:hypothetical protein